jgi:hypothetical protein
MGSYSCGSPPRSWRASSLSALVQERTADACCLGRVFATFLASFNGLMAVGMLLAGLVAVATLGRRARTDAYPRTSKRERIPLA